MGNRVLVKPHVELVTIRSMRRGGKGHTMGACMLENVTVKPDGLEGDLLDEWTEVRELEPDVLKHLTRIFHTEKGWHKFAGKNKRVPVTGDTFNGAYVCGPEFYVSIPKAQKSV